MKITYETPGKEASLCWNCASITECRFWLLARIIKLAVYECGLYAKDYIKRKRKTITTERGLI